LGDKIQWLTSDFQLRDLKTIGNRIRHVLIPVGSRRVSAEWDLWGPLILCLLLAVYVYVMMSVFILMGLMFSSLSWGADQGQSAIIFSAVFVIVWVGSAVVTINASLLGGHMYIILCISLFVYISF